MVVGGLANTNSSVYGPAYLCVGMSGCLHRLSVLIRPSDLVELCVYMYASFPCVCVSGHVCFPCVCVSGHVCCFPCVCVSEGLIVSVERCGWQ